MSFLSDTVAYAAITDQILRHAGTTLWYALFWGYHISIDSRPLTVPLQLSKAPVHHFTGNNVSLPPDDLKPGPQPLAFVAIGHVDTRPSACPAKKPYPRLWRAINVADLRLSRSSSALPAVSSSGYVSAKTSRVKLPYSDVNQVGVMAITDPGDSDILSDQQA